MGLNIPGSSKEVADRSKTDIELAWPGSNPFQENSAIGALASSHASRVYDYYLVLNLLATQLIPDTATDQFLERWATIWGITRNPATQSAGDVICTGTLSTAIPISTTFVDDNGNLYDSTAAATIDAFSEQIVITRVGSTATATFFAPHTLANNVSVDFAGAGQPEYNVTGATITVLNNLQVTYQVTGSPVSPATGTTVAIYDSGRVPVQSQDVQDSENNVNLNLTLNTPVNLQSPITNIDNLARVDADGLDGGLDQENNSALRLRYLDRLQNPIAGFNVAAITAKAKEVSGVTRVFVFEVTPAAGQVTVYFMRDNDSNPIPTPSEVTEVETAILTIKPVNMSDSDVIVSAPTASSTNFTFSSLTPNTSTMQNAIEANLQQFFSEETSVGVDVDEDKYKAAISNTVDPENGDTVQSFSLSAPIGDISISTGEIATLGTVTF